MTRPSEVERDSAEAKYPCEHCGCAIVVFDCWRCGAPNCCPDCCAQDAKEQREKVRCQ